MCQRCGAEAVDVAIELAVGDRAILRRGQADRKGAAEPDRREHDVANGEVGSELTAGPTAFYECGQHVVGSDLQIRPVVIIEKRMNDVHDADSALDRLVQVAPDRFFAVGIRCDDPLTGRDRVLEDVPGHVVQQRLAIRKVSVHGADAHPGAPGEGVTSRVAPSLEDQRSRTIEETNAVLACISAHRSTLPLAGPN